MLWSKEGILCQNSKEKGHLWVKYLWGAWISLQCEFALTAEAVMKSKNESWLFSIKECKIHLFCII